MLGIESFELTKVAGQFDLHENERIAGRRSLHFSGIGGFGLHIVDDALKQIALAKLLDGGGLVLNGLPHTGVVGLFCRVIVDAYGEIVRIPLIEKVALTDNASIALFQVGRSPRSIKMMSRHKPLLYVHTCAHLGSRTDKDADSAGLHIAEQFAFADVGVGIMNEGNLFGRNTLVDELLAQIVIDGELAGR